MYKALIIIIIFAISISESLSTGQITKKQALQVAHNFYYERVGEAAGFEYSEKLAEFAYKINNDEHTLLYFINFTDKGWICVAGSHAVVPVVAYSYNGSYNKNNIPENFNAWIDQYSAQVQEVFDLSIESPESTKALWDHYLNNNANSFKSYTKGRSLDPLLYSTWDQGLFYNEMCPADNAGPGGHCLTGCVPTCMGQIINYFRWPEVGTGSYSYDSGDYGILTANFGETYYNWSQMPSYLATNSMATAELLFHLGVSCDLVYGPSASGMYNHKAAYSLRTYFKYSPETEYLYRDSTDLNWDSVIMAHLDKKIPMYYAGWSVPNINGHAFAVDGYENSEYFHFNWGWSGSYDGYFYTSNLNPGGSNFNLAQELIINCFPDTVNYSYPVYTTGPDTLVAMAGSVDDGSGPVYDYLSNNISTWLIIPEDSVVSITIDFNRFDVDYSDTLFVYDGNNDMAELIGAFHGDTVPLSITSSSDVLFIKFVTDDSLNANGWLFDYSCETSVYCSNIVSNENSGTISDGSGPANYHNFTTCIWMIQPDIVDDIHLEFTSFETEADHDLVTVYDGSEKIGQFSGNELPPVLTATSGTMAVVFSTNSSVTDKGWEALYYTGIVGDSYINKENTLIVYPNPVNEILNVKCAFNITEMEVELVDLLGNVIYKQNQLTGNDFSLNVSEIREGIYIMRIYGDNSSISKKVIIKH